MQRLLPLLAAAALIAVLPAEFLSAQESEGAAAQAPVADTIAEARKQVAAIYVLPETGAALDKALGAAQAKGAFDGLSGEALANRINEVMRTVTKDGHLSVRYDPRAAAEVAALPPASEDDDAELPASYRREIARNNAGVAKLEVLPGNIRYMDYRGFMWGTPEAEAAIANAATFLRGGSAVIIDLRRNGGGSAAAVRALASYFLPPKTKLMRFEQRGHPGQVSETDPTPFTLADRPVYVLTSRGTFSAAEEFANHVSAFKFGTLVGETTGGGGFNNTFVPLPGGYLMSISYGRAVHMVTGKDWEQVGIAPAIAVPADQALTRAEEEAATALAANAAGDELGDYERLAAYYRALLDPAEPGHALADYAGQYGARTLAVDSSGALTVSRAGRPAVRLVAIGPDLFVPEAAPTQHYRFVAGGGAIEALEVDEPDGKPARFPRSAS